MENTDKRGRRRVGPVVGILTAGAGQVPGNRQMFRYVLQACRRAGITAYVFKPEQLHWSKGVATGYQWKSGRFVQRRFPLPDVVYNRVPNRKVEQSPLVARLKQRLRRHGIPYFNPGYLNKYTLHRILSREPEAVPYLPATAPVRRLEDIDRALRQFDSVYLKPKNAFAGRGIMRVSKGEGKYQLRYRVRNANQQQLFSSSAQLHSALRKKMGTEAYIVQQGINLARYRGRIFDVRLLAQRNESGKWQVTGMGVRVASQGGITTHVPNGGFIASAAEVLPAVFGNDASQVEQRVRQLAMTVVPLVEKGYGARFGEMSMDIGITPDGQPFFFEANAKPMKFDEDRIRGLGLGTLVGYMKYLWKTKGKATDGRV